MGDTDRCSCPRGHVSPDLTPSQVHRCRGPKMRAKLACKKQELNPLLLLGQLTVERGDSQRVWEARPPCLNLSLASASPRQTSPSAHPLHSSPLGQMALDCPTLREPRKLPLGDYNHLLSPSLQVKPACLPSTCLSRIRTLLCSEADLQPGILLMTRSSWPLGTSRPGGLSPLQWTSSQGRDLNASLAYRLAEAEGIHPSPRRGLLPSFY